MGEKKSKGLWYDLYPHSYFLLELIKLKDPKNRIEKKIEEKGTNKKKKNEKNPKTEQKVKMYLCNYVTH